MKGCVSTDLGIITIDPEVIAKYAGTVAVECFGIVGMAAPPNDHNKSFYRLATLTL